MKPHRAPILARVPRKAKRSFEKSPFCPAGGTASGPLQKSFCLFFSKKTLFFCFSTR
jgi:hypothetical protein